MDLRDIVVFLDASPSSEERLRLARAVTVMTVRTRDGDLQHHRESAQRVVRHLKRHDIPARTDHPLRCGSAVADVLLTAAADISADPIVSGAYHHSPWREALIGGVSRDLLEHVTVPVLMSHSPSVVPSPARR